MSHPTIAIQSDLLEMAEGLQTPHKKSEVRNQELLATQKELEARNQELLATREELEVRNQELQLTNFKLQAINHAERDLAAQAEKLNRLKDDFLSAISHELRSPLSNMKMAIHMLKTAPDAKRRETYLEILQAQCARQILLINNLLDLQQLEAGSYPDVLIEVVNLHEWLPIILEAVRLQTQQLQQTLQVNLAPEFPPLRSDRVSLGRILTELLNNASKYTPNGGEIALSVSYDLDSAIGGVSPDWSGAPACTPVATFTIRNQAEIQGADLSRIFDKFYRIPQVDRWQSGGMGLGLALVQKLVKHLQGTIQVESSEGWTTFIVCLRGYDGQNSC